ncbi:RCC1 domain-containing protein [Bifidobacterium xylocopae]|nr:hypothetical protein [Bifidobacterium xylocopae]
MRSFRVVSASCLALAMIVLGGGGLLTARPAHADPAETNPLLRGGVPASETVDGFTLSPTKGPANTAGTHTTITPPSPPTSGITFTQVSAGYAHSLAIGSDGNTYAWGSNDYGQLGDGSRIGSYIPVRVRTPAGVRFTQVSASDSLVQNPRYADFSLAIGDDGHAYSWGLNRYGQLGNGSSDLNPHPTPARIIDPAPDTTWRAISAGDDHSLGIDSNGHAYSWGYNGYGQLGNGSSGGVNPTPGRVTDPTPNTTWTSISAGGKHSLALDNNGHAYSWGINDFGQLGNNSRDNNPHPTPARVTDPAPNTTWKTISAGDYHNLAIDNHGHAYSWGDNDHGQLGNGSSGIGTNRTTPVRVTDPAPNTTWTTISACNFHSLAIDSDHHAYSWGDNRAGELGNGSSDTNPHPTPARVTDPDPNTTWKTISAGDYYSLAIDNNGHAYSWGYNDYGQLGNGSSDSRPTPHPTPARVTDPDPNTTWTTISAGFGNSLAIDSNGHAYSWGWNRYGQLGNGSNGTNPPDYDNADKHTPVPAGLRTIAVTGITLDRSDATPPPAWNTGNHTWDTTAPAHPDGQVTANIHWTLGGQPQPDYPLTYTYTHQYTLPKAGSIPIQRLSGETLLLLTTLAALTTTAHQHARRHQPGRHTTISA